MFRAAFLDTLWQDLRFGARTLFRSPGFAAIAALLSSLVPVWRTARVNPVVALMSD